MKKFSSILSLFSYTGVSVATMICMVPSAVAQDDGPPPPPRGPHGERPKPPHSGPRNKPDGQRKGPKPPHGGMADHFDELDTDNSGELSFEQFSKAPRLSHLGEAERRKIFNFLDRNKDGKIQRDELVDGKTRDRERFERFDTNGDGVLDRSEFFRIPEVRQMPEEKRKELFKRLDRNNDGKLQPDEMRRFRGPGGFDFKKLDTTGSGGLSFEEFIKAGFVARLPEDKQRELFKRFDLNGDGEITKEEVHRARAEGGGFRRGPGKRGPEGRRGPGERKGPPKKRGPSDNEAPQGHPKPGPPPHGEPEGPPPPPPHMGEE
ncbi:EF-hand domain-containing protein [Persicirhabdus sediminis]|uniref:EF-hand domain-containing protein n=1 Tax=Persicirhabdus sediminis TaxID=454144 RepID=A0A8J7MFY3_9BACT|nr:EF-hand domain-containing protein [Persicirhabdus sediminis]MBK1791089.1 EF-hand domain-containing protein [Persicirhabdus sediminis]